MEEEHRKAIQNNFSSLVEQTDLDTMVSSLYEKGVFSEQMIEPYKDSNKDMRTRKRELYRNITRRGPLAFGHLVDALTEAGHWNLVRDLDPNSMLHARPNRSFGPNTSSHSNESNFVSLRTEKNKTKSGANVINNNPAPRPPPPPPPTPPPVHVPDVNNDTLDPTDDKPQFEVIKSTKFFEDDGGALKLYRTRSRQRGILLMLTYIKFENDVEVPRLGAHVDRHNLKHLFHEIGFKVIGYQNLTKKQTLETLGSLREVMVGAECVFVVVSSHGYERYNSGDINICCSDGQYITYYDIVEHFNNYNFTGLRGIPKVFIFQLCRGSKKIVDPDPEWAPPPPHMQAPGGARPDGTPCPPGTGPPGTPPPGTGPPGTGPPGTPHPHRDAPDARALDDNYRRDTPYSDILIAHSTLPGYVSYRDITKGSWYIQVLCEVFAKRAHDCEVQVLFALVDQLLQKRFSVQTSSVDRWGFNGRLYLHPGLFEDD